MIKAVLKRADTSHYSNANHLEFNKLASGIFVKHASEIDNQPMIDEHSTAVTQEGDVFDWMHRSEFTEKKAVVDRRRDEVYMGITGTVRVNLNHFNPEMKNAAAHVFNLLSNSSYIPGMNYDAETAAIDTLVTRLRSDAYAPAVLLLGLTTWVDELDSLNTKFKTYADDTSKEEINRPKVSSKEARVRSDNALWRITNRVESLVSLNGSTTFVAFIEEFNTLVKHYNTLLHEHLGRIHAKTDISNAVISLISLQPATGKPVFVIPEVCLHDSAPDGSVKVTELVFATDFSVDYANNVKPGTATLIITGTGKYKGEIVTTFNIGPSEA